jgi:polyphosphate:AMP phosphotransferase
MFRAAKLGRRISKSKFKTAVPELRTELLAAQRDLRESSANVIVIVLGVDGAGKGEVVNRLNEWLDTRGMQTFAFWDETDEERDRPNYWRFWRAMPARGDINVLFGGWYQRPFEERFNGRWSDAELDNELNQISDFERMLSEDGTLIVKFWLHLPEDVERKKLKSLNRDDPDLWKTLPRKGKFSKHYQQYERVGERMIRHTDSGTCPWYLIEATDELYRDLTIGRTLLRSIRNRLAHDSEETKSHLSHAPSLPEEESARTTVLDRVDLTQQLVRDEYRNQLERYQRDLHKLAWKAYRQQRSTVMVFEGVDAGGKGGAIRRITSAIDSRLYRTIPVAAPTDEEKSHHYLWRFWRHIPRSGRATIYDRSWYGRVLVERVEGFAAADEWKRAYAEINQFEEQLTHGGIIVLKNWLHISPDEQLARFKQREETSYKQHKITDEDWRNREKWDDYKLAVNEMVIRTSSEFAPWTLVPGNDKKFARVFVLKNLCERLEEALD